ncbi:MAG: phosphoribosylamine--glycine ligase [Planctomycetota bacterium]
MGKRHAGGGRRGGEVPEQLSVLVVGEGGREHALAWRLKQSSRVKTLYTTATGEQNPGLRAIAKSVDHAWSVKELYRLEQFIARERINLVVVGPEAPLAGGIVDQLTESRSIGEVEHDFAVFGPTTEAAQLESSKAWAKQLMRAASIPTADARVFHDVEAARAYVESREEPPVIKASGLAAGKGVSVPDSIGEALGAVEAAMVDGAFGEAGRSILIEERMSGPEVSVFALCDGRTVALLPSCQDHKRLTEGDTGPNTGGMGAYAPTPVLSDRQTDDVVREIVVPTIDALRREGIEYRGVLYVGLMLTHAGPKVLEYNVRFGDPECQVLMRLLEGDLAALLWRCATGSLEEAQWGMKNDAAVCVTMASPGYPTGPTTGQTISGLDEAGAMPGVELFHAGTGRRGGSIVAAGGRVLSVTATAPSIGEARDRANAACECIGFDGALWRRDIAHQAIGASERAGR